jgi:Tol biopolymer transport system component
LGPRWGSNGGWAVFQSDRDGNWEIYRTLVPSHTLERVTNLGSQELIDAQVLSPEYGQLGRGAALRLLSPIIK